MFKLSTKNTNILQRMLLLGSVIAMVCLWVLGIQRTEDLFLSEIIVDIDKVENVRDLITKKDILHMVEKGLPNDIRMQTINSVDIAEVETMLGSDSRIYKVEVFIDSKQAMNIEVIQRRPIFRVMNRQGDQYYIDQLGEYVSQSEFRAVRVPVVTGFVESLKPDTKISKKSRLYKAFTIVNQIRKDNFLSALVEQIDFERDDRIVLIPKIGDEKIILDHIDDLPEKLKNLKGYYKELAKTNTWGRYDEIDISYRKQVIGRNPVTP